MIQEKVLTIATALLYGSLASSSFVIGVLLGLFTSPSRRLVATVIGFGAGVLVSAVTFDLMREAFDKGGGVYAISGFLIGAVIYVAADVALERMAATSPKRTGCDATDVVPEAEEKPERPKVAEVAGTALLVGAVIDFRRCRSGTGGLRVGPEDPELRKPVCRSGTGGAYASAP